MNNTEKTWLGHPRGLFVLFMTELWERFSFYGMRAILVLYLTAKTTDQFPGLAWTNQEALAFYGWYGFLVYMAALPGGYIADRILGQKQTVFLGAVLLAMGHGILAIQANWAFYTGIALIIGGVGCLKPNISTMVGGLYDLSDIRRDRGFTIFYVGINIGAAISPILVGYVAHLYGWHYGFGLAGIGMAISLIWYRYGYKYLTQVGNFMPTPMNENKVRVHVLLTREEKDRMKLLGVSFLILIVFWGAYEQAGGMMNLYAEQKTNRMIGSFEVPASWFQSLSAIFVILFGGLVATIWERKQKKGKEASSMFKMSIGTMIMGSGFFFMSFAALQHATEGKAAMYWLVLAYLFHVIGELSSSPVVLSFITKLAPARYASVLMGAYWAITGLGEKLAGLLGEWSQSLGEFAIFTGIAVFCVVFGGVLLLFLPLFRRWAHGADGQEVKD